MKQFIILTIFLSCISTSFSQNVGIGTNTPQEQLHTTGTVRFAQYSGKGTRLVQIDSVGNLVVSAAGAVNSNNNPMSIFDNGCPTAQGASSTIAITGMPTAVNSANISVRVNIAHEYVSDLQLYLIAPNGTALCLSKNAGGSGDNYTNTIFSDAGATTTAAGVAPFTGIFKPLGGVVTCGSARAVSNFAGFNGGSIVPNGNWILRVYDGAAVDAGTLINWSISFSGASSLTSDGQNNYLPKFSSGNLIASKIYQNETTGNIGIGTTTPAATLDVNGIVSIAGGQPGLGKVLTDTTGTGIAKWKSLPSVNSGFRATPVIGSSGGGTFGITALPTLPDDFADFPGYNAYFFTAKENGVYYFEVCMKVSGGVAATNGLLGVSIRKQLSDVAVQRISITAGQTVDAAVSVSTIIKLEVGQVVDFQYSQGLFQTLTFGSGSHVAGHRIY